jgi:hypothetical protein
VDSARFHAPSARVNGLTRRQYSWAMLQAWPGGHRVSRFSVDCPINGGLYDLPSNWFKGIVLVQMTSATGQFGVGVNRYSKEADARY